MNWSSDDGIDFARPNKLRRLLQCSQCRARCFRRRFAWNRAGQLADTLVFHSLKQSSGIDGGPYDLRPNPSGISKSDSDAQRHRAVSLAVQPKQAGYNLLPEFSLEGLDKGFLTQIRQPMFLQSLRLLLLQFLLDFVPHLGE